MKTKLPFIITLSSLVLGVFIAILFGANEHMFKNKIKNDVAANVKISMITDETQRKQKMAKERSKLWRYYQRSHFHATGISSMSLVVLILLAFSLAPAAYRLTASYMISVGGFLYPFVWFFAGHYGGVMGRSEAKEAFAFFGYMGGVFFLGTIYALVLLIKYPLKFREVES